MASRVLTDLSPSMQGHAVNFLHACAGDTWLQHNGISVIVICTYRSNEEQDALYAQGRTKPGSIVTNARAGQSAHNVKMLSGRPSAEAFDFLPLRNGKPVWGTKGNGIDDDPSDDERDDLEVWQRCGQHAVGLGLKWFGSPGSAFHEQPHCQSPTWRLR